MKFRSYARLTIILLVALLLGGCNTALPTTTGGESVDVAALTAENQRIQTEYAELLARVEELDEAVRTTGFLAPRVITEPVIFAGGSDTLERVQNRGTLYCGVNIDAPGFGYLDVTSGDVDGFDIDFCRAVAAAIFGQRGATQVEVKAVTARNRFATLQSGDIDLLIRNTSWVLTRDATLGIDFAGPIFYDKLGVLVPSREEWDSPRELAGQTLCALGGGSAAAATEEFFAFYDVAVEIDVYDNVNTALRAYEAGECSGFVADSATLIGQLSMLEDPEAHVILEEESSREPLSPAVRHNDSGWRDIVEWVVQCTVNAEFLNVSRQNAAMQRNSDDIRVQRLLGTEGDLGVGLGLNADFCYQVIDQVGNYADIYGRHLGPGTDFNLPRGPNALYTDGGLLYPLPFR